MLNRLSHRVHGRRYPTEGANHTPYANGRHVLSLRELTLSFKGGIAPYFKEDLPIPGWFGDMMVDINKKPEFARGFHAMWNFNIQSDMASTVRLFKDPDNHVSTTFLSVDGPPSNDAVFNFLQA